MRGDVIFEKSSEQSLRTKRQRLAIEANDLTRFVEMQEERVTVLNNDMQRSVFWSLVCSR